MPSAKPRKRSTTLLFCVAVAFMLGGGATSFLEAAEAPAVEAIKLQCGEAGLNCLDRRKEVHADADSHSFGAFICQVQKSAVSNAACGTERSRMNGLGTHLRL